MKKASEPCGSEAMSSEYGSDAGWR